MSQQIRTIEDTEALMISATTSSSTGATASYNESTCLSCHIVVVEGKYIKCSKCLKFIHFNCNTPIVSKYFIGTPGNFKCQLCKPKKLLNLLINKLKLFNFVFFSFIGT